MALARTPVPAPALTARAVRAGAVVAVLALAPFMSSLDLFIVNLAFPAIGREFPSVGLGQLSWVLNAYTIVFAAALIPAGRFADRIGRRRMFAGGLALFTVGSLLCGLAPGVAWLVAARVVQALGAGAMVPASMSLLLAAVPASRRATALGSWSAVGALGAALGPVVGGVLVQLGWRWVFWVNLPVGVLAVVLSLRWLTESRDEARGRRPDLLGAAGLALSVGLVAWSLIEAPGRGWTSPAVLGALTGAVVLGSLTVLRSARHPAPVLELSLLRSRPMGGAVLASVLYYAGFGAFVLCAVEFLTGVWGYSPLRAGLAIAPGPLVVLPFARLVAPRLVGLLGGAGRVAAIGCGVNALAQGLWFLLLQVQPAYVTHLLPVQLLGGAGVGLAIPSLLGAGSAGFSAARLGTGSGILNMARQIGAVLGVAGLVAVLVAGGLDPLTPFRRAVLVIVGFFLAAGVVCVATLLRRPEEER